MANATFKTPKQPPDPEFVNDLIAQRKALMATVRTFTYQSLDPAVRHHQVVPYATYAPWMDDREFQAVYGAVRDHTLVDEYRCHALWSLMAQTGALPGDVIEVGTWRGGSGALLAAAARRWAPEARVFLCDTFRGVVKSGELDPYYVDGRHDDTDVATVRALLERLGLGNADILAGAFPDETGERIAGCRFRFCHIDVDTYGSARDVNAWVWPRLAVGGIVVYDDFGFWGCEGVTRCVNEQLGLPDRIVIHNLNGHAVVIKTRADATAP